MIDCKGCSDLELFVLLKEGNQSAFSELYNRYKQALYFHACRSIKNTDESRDIVQEVFTALWTKRESLVIPKSVDAYLYGSIRNRILNFIAHQKVVSKYADSIDAYLEQAESTTEELLSAKELTHILQKEISLLPEKMREVFELSRNHELSYKQIAEQLNISDQSVKKQVHRALKILRLKIKLNLFFTFFCW